MAAVEKRTPENVPGEFFVDATCIDCDTCRQLAPEVFADAGEHAFVHRQPTDASHRRRALHALVSCPTGSIGALGGADVKAAFADFPLLIDGPVYYCGFTSPKSYGGSSYFVRREGGNWLIDSPKFLPQLVRKLHDLGGIAHLFLTHEDDVADAAKYATEFGAGRIIHRAELSAQPDAERVLDGVAPIELAPGLIAIPTPGHTAEHCCLLIDNRYLFTGDHLAWDGERLTAFRDYCWHSWAEQTRSMERLAEFEFEWVLPGHGRRVNLPAGEMSRRMCDLITRMEAE